MTCDRVIDHAALARFHEWGGDRLQDEMIRIFLKNSVVLVRQIREGFDDGDRELVQRSAHSLKSTAATVGAMGLSDIAAGIEDAVEEGRMDVVRSRLQPLVDASEQVWECLREFQAGKSERS